MKTNILYIEGGENLGGSTISLGNILNNTNYEIYKPIVITLYQGTQVSYLNNILADGSKVIVLKSLYCSVFLKKHTRFECINKLLSKVTGIILERLPHFLQIFFILIRKKVGLVHLNNGPYFPAIIASACLRIRCIVHLRSLPSKVPLTSKIMARYSTSFIAVSNAVKEEYTRQGFKKNFINVIYDGIDLKNTVNKFAINRSEIRRIYRLNGDEIIVGTAGRLVKWKRQDILISAIDRLLSNGINVKCMIIGSEENNIDSIQYKKYLKDLVSEKNLQEEIIFTGFQKNPMEMIQALNIFVLPSIIEPFGMVILEAMALGVPVIAFNAGGPAEIIEDRKNGLLVAVGDIKELSEAMYELLENNELYKKLAYNAIKLVETEYNLEQFYRKISCLYSKTLNRLGDT